ncbi:MAG TPA: UDP-N-acetylmuramoyl-tripeptide--D-alanyl-D-alanine ligase [Planctomycetota bacterium]|nr:UDP-N-acetylmuramoyl-tripeptide--D-alanyl-D-alanine ligase [Planctomycetota bacterium]HRU51097.1 UDP-N-acetylmuramoyl-tripeptide--D-alanyl-D-alanine ligase [Planctomycetota bacterium]
MKILISDIVKTTQGQCFGVNLSEFVVDFTTDSRKVQKGSCFIALRGERFDGHDFIQDVVQQGASVCIVDHKIEHAPCIVVHNTIQALGQLGVLYSTLFSPIMIGITGSVGKTTTKGFLENILSHRFSVLCSPKSFNNNIGIPLTFFELKKEHEIVIMEMGTNHLGEIAELSQMVRPKIGVLTSVAESHLEGFGTLEEVAREKGDLLKGMDENSTLIYNEDNIFCSQIAEKFSGKKIGYSIKTLSNIQSDAFHISFELENISFLANIAGMHNLSNLLATIFVAHELGMSFSEIANTMDNVKLPERRLERTELQNIVFLNDAYNANPASMIAALQYLKTYPGNRRIAILGNMLELGEKSTFFHEKIGESLDNISILFCIGTLAKHISIKAKQLYPHLETYTYETWEHAKQQLIDILQSGDILLFKGSRRMELDQLCEYCIEHIKNNNEK